MTDIYDKTHCVCENSGCDGRCCDCPVCKPGAWPEPSALDLFLDNNPCLTVLDYEDMLNGYGLNKEIEMMNTDEMTDRQRILLSENAAQEGRTVREYLLARSVEVEMMEMEAAEGMTEWMCIVCDTVNSLAVTTCTGCKFDKEAGMTGICECGEILLPGQTMCDECTWAVEKDDAYSQTDDAHPDGQPSVRLDGRRERIGGCHMTVREKLARKLIRMGYTYQEIYGWTTEYMEVVVKKGRK